VFAAIYHPVGIAMLVKDEPRIGLALGINGVAGNLGLAFAALLSGALADLISWRAAFIVPGVVSILCGLWFWAYVPRALADAGGSVKKAASQTAGINVARVFAILVVSTFCGGVIFNATTVAMPKVFDIRLNELTNTAFGVGAFVCGVYVLAAIAQLCVGRMIDRGSLRSIFVPIAAFQIPLLFLAGSVENWLMVLVALAMMFFVFGQIPINDAMVARYTDDRWRSRVYGLRYVISFGASSTAVPLIAFLYGRTGDFQSVFVVLSALAVPITLAALFFPKSRETASMTVAAE
jgi:MFS family permease